LCDDVLSRSGRLLGVWANDFSDAYAVGMVRDGVEMILHKKVP
jgi:hypothetical protein